MPLRAKILSSAFSTSPNMSAPRLPEAHKDDDPDDVLFGSIYGVRTIELNRPKKLNSLNGSMARKILPRLKEWENSQLANVIIMSGAGPKAFCAGGDVAALALENKKGKAGQKVSTDYFGLEYQLDHTIATYTKPYIAYMDGITMGGGVGLSVNAPIRIATERTVFAMPETTIGFFPDVGGSFFLPRLDGALGTYLALTSERLEGVDVYHAGIATHYIASESLGGLTTRLSELVFKDYNDMQNRLELVDQTIEEFFSGLPRGPGPVLSGEIRKQIDVCFSPKTVEGIISKLEQLAADSSTQPTVKTWAEKTKDTILTRSPTSLKVTRRLMEVGKEWDIAQTFQREYHVAETFMAHADFVEGVSAKLINKPATTPKWSPATLAEVSDQDVDKFLETEGRKKLELFSNNTYKENPYRAFAPPRAHDVKELLNKARYKTVAQFLEAIKGEYNNKPGSLRIVQSIIDSKTEKGNDGHLVWKE